MTTAQTISRVVKTTGVIKSESRRGRAASTSSEGFTVSTNWKKEIVVGYKARTASLFTDAQRTNFAARQTEALNTIVAALTSKGYAVEVIDGEIKVA